MFLLGVLGVLQAVFVPGFIVLRYLKLNEGLFKTWILSFSISLVINNFIVIALVALKLFRPEVVYSIFLIEMVLLVTISRADWKMPAVNVLRYDYENFMQVMADCRFGTFLSKLSRIMSLFLALLTFAYFLKLVLQTFLPVFNIWDDIVSWNRWAVAWYKGGIPEHTMNYPQLLPTNWAMIYKFMSNSNIQGFAKCIMPLFPLSILVGIFDLALRTRRLGYMLAVSTTGFLLLYVMGYPYLTSGYADIPVAFMAFVPVYLLLVIQNQDTKLVQRYLVVGTTCCIGAGLTKQAGVFIMAIYPILSYFFVFGTNPEAKKNFLRKILLMYLSLFAFVAPWYIFTQVRIHTGGDVSEIFLVKDSIHQGRTLVGRFFTAITRLMDGIQNFPQLKSTLTQHGVNLKIVSTVILISVFCSGAMSFFDKTWKKLICLMTIPYFFIWALCFSYDLRNLSLAIPFLGVATGVGLEHFLRSTQSIKDCLVSAKTGTAFALAVIAALAMGLSIDDSRLIERHNMLRRQVGLVQANDMLYAYQQQHGLEGKILTNYHLMRYLPDLDKFYRGFGFNNVSELEKALQSSDARYLMILKNLNEKIPDPVNKYLAEQVRRQKLKVIPSVDWVMFLKVEGGL